MTTDDIEALRARLLFMRRDLVERLARQIDGGVMALLGSVGQALAALDAMSAELAHGEPHC